MSISKSIGNEKTTLPNRDHAERGFSDDKETTCSFLQSEMGKPKVFSIKDLEGILARPGCKPISLDEMEEAIALGAMATMGRVNS